MQERKIHLLTGFVVPVLVLLSATALSSPAKEETVTLTISGMT
jgi:hypothetical protein